MKLTWIGHSCFKIEKNGYSIVVDPYTAGSVPGLDAVNVSANQVLCSHEHGDHNGRAEVELIESNAMENPFRIEVIETYHDEVCGAKRGTNKIFIISDGKQRVAHFGDLGCELPEDQMNRLKGLDAALIPVGGYYTIDGRQAADLMVALKPRIVIPMHFRDDAAGFGYDVIDTAGMFTEKMDSVMTLPVSEIDTEDEQRAKVVVLQPLRRQA
ncbi:MAG: MBL fold metallo-hydrolase [Eubacteriales bacterium]|nr:MBL fold metallo-hydrolase [Eubacteriales bacterium]